MAHVWDTVIVFVSNVNVLHGDLDIVDNFGDDGLDETLRLRRISWWTWECTSYNLPNKKFHLLGILDCVREGVPHFLAVLALLLEPSVRLPRDWHSFEETEQQEDIHLLLESQLADYLDSSNEEITGICPDDLTSKRSSKRWSTYRASVRAPSRTSTGSWNLSRAPFFSFRFRRVSWPVSMWGIGSSRFRDNHLPCPIP